jgi:hypothetical protein
MDGAEGDRSEGLPEIHLTSSCFRSQRNTHVTRTFPHNPLTFRTFHQPPMSQRDRSLTVMILGYHWHGEGVRFPY